MVAAIPIDIGNSLLKLTSSLTVSDYYAPENTLSYVGGNGTGLCINDEDFSSGGVLLPPAFTYNGNSVVVNADKQSNLYVANQSSLGHYNASGGNNLETVLTPCFGGPPTCPNNPTNQGYWASPAYWYDGTNSWLFYSPTAWSNKPAAPFPVYGYKLATSGASGPISQTATASTVSRFCQYTPTPSVSSKPNASSATGILWAIETGNSDNPNGGGSDCNGSAKAAALHAFNASTLASLYSSGTLTTTVGEATAFSTPTIFQGRVYMGTTDQNTVGGSAPGVDVFGLCSSQTSGCLP